MSIDSARCMIHGAYLGSERPESPVDHVLHLARPALGMIIGALVSLGRCSGSTNATLIKSERVLNVVLLRSGPGRRSLRVRTQTCGPHQGGRGAGRNTPRGCSPSRTSTTPHVRKHQQHCGFRCGPDRGGVVSRPDPWPSALPTET
jgi:hypothetical protein